MTSALTITNFTKQYGTKTAVDNISFSIAPGEFFGFLGPNGAGKSSTIHCITGIAKISSGYIQVFGNDVVSEYRLARKKIGLAPQEFNVDIWAKVRKILWYMGGYMGVPSRIRQKKIEELFDIFDLHSYQDTPFLQLSGGLKRRVILARALVHDPALLILDEPTAGVDVELRHELWKYLERINQEGKTILFTSHYLEEVEQLCNRIAIIHSGKLIAIGDKSEFVSGGKTLEKRYLELINRK